MSRKSYKYPSSHRGIMGVKEQSKMKEQEQESTEARQEIDTDLLRILKARITDKSVISFCNHIAELNDRYRTEISTKYLRYLNRSEPLSERIPSHKITKIISRLMSRARAKGLRVREQNRYFGEHYGNGTKLKRETINFLFLQNGNG